MTSPNPETVAGFNRFDAAGNDWIRQLREKHSLSEPASLEQIEPVATRLLSDVVTMMDGVTLVLNRSLDYDSAEDKRVLRSVLLTAPEERFGILLIIKATEQIK